MSALLHFYLSNDDKDVKENEEEQSIDLSAKIAFHTTSQRINAVYSETPYKKERILINDSANHQIDIALKQHQYWNKYFKTKIMPESGDWLHAYPNEQSGQSFNAWYNYIKKGRQCKIYPMLLKANKHNIGLVTVGSFNIYLTKSLHSLFDILSEITSTFYFDINIDIIQCIPTSNIKSRHNSMSNTKQLKTGSICSELKRIKKAHPELCCLMGISLIDLYPDESWNFVFGEASCCDSVGIFSFSRYLPGFDKISQRNYKTNRKLVELKAMLDGKQMRNDPNWLNQILSDKDQVLFIRRCIQVLTHEIGHLFGLNHCPYFECVMNGANHLIESDIQPLHLCPICLHKLYFVTLLMQKTQNKIKRRNNKGNTQYLDILTRYQRLSKLFNKYGLVKESKWYRNRAQFVFQSLTKNEKKKTN